MKTTSRSRISLAREQAEARLLRSTQQHEEMEASGGEGGRRREGGEEGRRDGRGIFSVKGER